VVLAGSADSVWAGTWRRPCLVANRATLPQKWPPPPRNVSADTVGALPGGENGDPKTQSLISQASSLNPQFSPSSSHKLHHLSLNLQASTLHTQHSTLNLQPATLNSQASSLKPQASSLNSQTSTLNPQRHTRWYRGCTGRPRRPERRRRQWGRSGLSSCRRQSCTLMLLPRCVRTKGVPCS